MASTKSCSSTDKNEKRNLPSWMNSKKDGNRSDGKKHTGDFSKSGKGSGKNKIEKASTHSEEREDKEFSEETSQRSARLSKLLEGVIFVLSGFVNPERSTLRSQALEMGAEYKPDWTAECTLLICAFPNTPKFRQVEADSGTIVSKEWISECYKKKCLLEIDQYLMHAGKPWRKIINSHDSSQGEQVPPRKLEKHEEKKTPSKSSVSTTSKDSPTSSGTLSPTEVKEWAIDDLNQTISWLESQEEKPEPDEVKKIAAEGIMTCLQDAIEALDKNQDIQHIMEQWMFVPRVVKELADLEHGKTGKVPLTKAELTKLAFNCKHVYAAQFRSPDDSPAKNKKLKTMKDGTDKEAEDEGYDSDATIEMTEEEIEQAWRGL